MVKKLNTKGAMDKFFSKAEAETSTTPTAEETQATSTTEKKKAGNQREKRATFRFSLYLDGALKNFVGFIVWKRRHGSITQYLNDLIRADMEAYIKAGGSEDEWKDWNEK